eukprot:3654424-Prymnesium_polylepis.1
MMQALLSDVVIELKHEPEAQSEMTPALAPDLKRYTKPQSIWAALRTGHVRLLRASWRALDSGSLTCAQRRPRRIPLNA